MERAPGNLLGNPRAEADSAMLGKAFVQTADYHALVNTTDFHIVVGRRGSGKSALYANVRAHFQQKQRTLVHAEIPREHDALRLVEQLMQCGCDYRSARAAARLMWRSYILRVVASTLADHYKIAGKACGAELRDYLDRAKAQPGIYAHGAALMAHCEDVSARALPARLAAITDIDASQEVVGSALEITHMKCVVMFDSLDEGWEPAPVATALLGGLVATASDYKDAGVRIHVLAFVRDNMFRALAHFDPDFSRYVEGSDLRLHWSAEALFALVAARLRVALDIQQENNERVWARFAQRGLEGRAGFEKCLQNTLYRPRDALALLNRAYHAASRAARDHIIDDDVAGAGKDISVERLSDLVKEYQSVLPGVALLVKLFECFQATIRYDELVAFLDSAIEAVTFDTAAASDLAILGSGAHAFQALYGIGFLGVDPSGNQRFMFCHDGTTTGLPDIRSDSMVAVHPCYWRALSVLEQAGPVSVLGEVYDEYRPAPVAQVRDLRLRRLGQVVEELSAIPLGDEGSGKFEAWVERSIQILFASHLTNVKLHPSPSAVQRRDIVASNSAERGFWSRVRQDYGAKQVVFEVKNYENLGPDDFRQALAYGGKIYGSVTFLVYRGQDEAADDNERSWIRELWTNSSHLVVLVPAVVLSRCIRKLRSPKRTDYWEAVLGKRLDTHLRSYLSTPAGKRRKRSK